MPDTEQGNITNTSTNMPTGSATLAMQEEVGNTVTDESPIISWLLEQNERAHREYTDPDAYWARRQYRALHPTEIAVFKCMDGRLNVAVITETPVGIIQPFRNIGGQFDLGWGNFNYMVNGWVKYSVSKGRNCIPIITYHFARGSHHGGCAGHEYHTDNAMLDAKKLVNQFSLTFGRKREVVHPILVGIETELDTLIFHGDNGTLFDVSKNLQLSREEVLVRLSELYPHMKKVMRVDLAELILGNMRHVSKLKECPRAPIDNEHREPVLAIGRGFDWLHVPNKALIIGPFGYELNVAIAKAGGIILDNFEKRKTISVEDGCVVMISGLYYEEGSDRILAEQKTLSLYRLAKAVLHQTQPDLMKHKVSFVVGVTSHDTRKFILINHLAEEPTFEMSPEEQNLVDSIGVTS